MNQSEKLGVFKKACSRWHEYETKIYMLDNELEELQLSIDNVHSPSFAKISPTVSPGTRGLLPLFEKKDLLIKEREYYKTVITWVESIINGMDTNAYKIIVMEVYVRKKGSFESIGEKMNMNGESLRRSIIREINKAYYDLDILLKQRGVEPF